MRLFIQGSEDQKSELMPSLSGQNNFTFSDLLPMANDYKDSDAFFILDQNHEGIEYNLFQEKPVFINEVILTLPELGTPDNIYRINGWPSFLQREKWEVAGKEDPKIFEIFKKFGKKPILVKDSPGMVAARVISMIVNEAFYALKEKVSTKAEIDLAMKLGTNYPYGPFEWSEKIGLRRIYQLLLKLSQTDDRCIPCFTLDSTNQVVIS